MATKKIAFYMVFSDDGCETLIAAWSPRLAVFVWESNLKRMGIPPRSVNISVRPLPPLPDTTQVCHWSEVESVLWFHYDADGVRKDQ